jgi:phosphinothricin acetyltransferase
MVEKWVTRSSPKSEGLQGSRLIARASDFLLEMTLGEPGPSRAIATRQNVRRVEQISTMTNTIRFAEPRDAAAIQTIYAPYCDASGISFETAAPSVEEIAVRIERLSARYPWLVAEIDGFVAGYVYACPHRERAAYRWSVDAAIYVDAIHQRRGVGRALYTSLLAMLREQGYFKAFAGIALPNPASVGVHEAVGFTPLVVFRGVGFKLGQWRDVGWWQLELQPEKPDPPEPTPIAELRESRAVATAIAVGQKLLG